MATTMALEDAAESLAEWVRDGQFGPLTVLLVEPRTELDGDGVPAIYLRLMLADPAAGAETWPLEPVLALRRAILGRANELRLYAPVYVQIRPESDPPQDQEEQD